MRDGRITEAVVYCNGGWDADLRARHAAEAPMLRPWETPAMSAVDDRTMTAADVLAAVQALAPSISRRAAEIEAARRLPADLLDELKAAGAFRLVLPPSHGGVGAELVEAMRRVSRRSPPPTRRRAGP